MQQNRVFLFLVQFLSYLWYFAVFLVILPFIVINVGNALDYLLFNYLIKIPLSDLGPLLPFLEPLVNIAASFFLIFGLGLIICANQVLSQAGASFPLSVITHKDLNPQKLASSGPYAYVRHPMFLGYLLILVGLAIFTRTLMGIFWVIPLLAALTLEYLLASEERHLLSWFGEEYQNYRARTPALIPKWK